MSETQRDQKLIENGVDIWLIRENLRISYEARIQQHQDTLSFIDELQQAKSQGFSLKYASESSKTPQTSHR